MPTSVLILDPYPIVRAGLMDALSGCADLHPSELEDPAEAVAEIARIRPDVAILDLTLDSVSGLDLICELRTHSRHTKVLIFSSFDERVYARRVLRAGASGFVPKTAPSEVLIQAVRDVARGGLAYGESALQAWGPNGGSEPGEVLSNRELDVFLLLGRGLSPQDIGEKLCIAMKTVYKHMANVKGKLGLPAGSGLTHHATVWVMEHAQGRLAS